MRPYLKPYVIRKEADGRFMTDSILTVGNTTDISIKGRHFNGTRGLWELLTYKNVTRGVVTAEN